jgi:hypothetical protein
VNRASILNWRQKERKWQEVGYTVDVNCCFEGFEQNDFSTAQE